MRDPDGAFFRGGPDWPRFRAQILARHCRGAIPRPIDTRPLPAHAEWPYFDPQFLPLFWPQLGIDPQDRQRSIAALAAAYAPRGAPDGFAAGIWCGPITLHFGHMIADFGMRIVASARADGLLPLVFSMPPFRDLEPPAFFWEMLAHFGVDRRRVLLIRKPARFDRLYVTAQAERPFGHGPNRRHLRLMDQIAGAPTAATAIGHDLDHVFVSRARLAEGRFAGEAYIDATLAAAGVTIFHPETADLQAQLQLYRRARTLIFSEGSALHALQLLGHLDCDIVVLVRRPGNRMLAASLRPRAHSVRYLPAARGLVYGLTASGHPIRRAGLSVLDEPVFLAGLKSAGVELTAHWDRNAYAERRDADIDNWIAERRARPRHPRDQALIEQHLHALSLPA